MTYNDSLNDKKAEVNEHVRKNLPVIVFACLELSRPRARPSLLVGVLKFSSAPSPTPIANGSEKRIE